MRGCVVSERGPRLNEPVGTSPPGVVALREVRAADLPILCAQQQDPVANSLAAFPARDTDAFRAHWARILADPTVAYVHVRSKFNCFQCRVDRA